ncbi:hypothetical protein A2631_02950 [Candidatus Daviesbacteria bacterium RIFCSPHIGHO2_01_FULL_44_29]|uniref:Glycosyltransferase 2-like domain-containing protein n=1 Tax=Candidatus Daviesbacteria bacterium RIFCSPHIGHO2_02_FULL_43_12 TaxID=1797776 RepID=A0A1F5KKC4_9BACT|nr:MAG: hypothetical protein A2631_02950 [Candidatus Daviesbacteria bacterium RIFCSPHIGHO2_01_FULL_44_29]OGE40805.1 MAG: hypothetical protein A3E86_02400 [Candidatus Daviesbacteria bacterium RIFCSPHIGHO2_12_FULL_47_45]OGE41342.1 MAG: hypothetical protein A3D25_02345 [Candidatus Daviesbacteria bacterium RIFCSPHIGHO2_02_FULL_43_12]OGE69543.1 MAG: hypothetical protein A3B55_04090 [Candidatus Daviesbacteria bacterium RIFCSPLOWO2_01_FULL_43_15]
MKLSIITVTYNNAQSLVGFIESVLTNAPLDSELVIVDSSSTDETVDMLKKFGQKIVLILSSENIGFGKGSNLGFQRSTGEFVMFLNPDTKVSKTALADLLLFIENHPEVGIVAPALIQKDGNIQPSVRRLPTLWGAIQEYYLGIKRSYEAYVPENNRPQEVESVVGAGMMMRRETFAKLGGFSSKFFMYYEDLELCLRVRKLGLKVYYLPEVKIEHEVGGSFSEQKLQWLRESATMYHGALSFALISLLLRLRKIAWWVK